jgi:hypothetical protein
MATIKLTDTFGFATDVQLRDKGAITKYFKPLPETIRAAELNLTADSAATRDCIKVGGGTTSVVLSVSRFPRGLNRNGRLRWSFGSGPKRASTTASLKENWFPERSSPYVELDLRKSSCR